MRPVHQHSGLHFFGQGVHQRFAGVKNGAAGVGHIVHNDDHLAFTFPFRNAELHIVFKRIGGVEFEGAEQEALFGNGLQLIEEQFGEAHPIAVDSGQDDFFFVKIVFDDLEGQAGYLLPYLAVVKDFHFEAVLSGAGDSGCCKYPLYADLPAAIDQQDKEPTDDGQVFHEQKALEPAVQVFPSQSDVSAIEVENAITGDVPEIVYHKRHRNPVHEQQESTQLGPVARQHR